MIIIIISIILALGLFIIAGLKKNPEYRSEYIFKFNRRQLVAILPLLLILTNLIAIVPANHVGILYSPFAGVKEETIPEGWNKKGLLDKVYKINTEVQTVQLSNITGQTRDAQWVEMVLDIKYKVDPTTAYQVFKQYRNLENVGTSLIPPTVQRSIENITTQYNIMDLLGEERNAVYLGVENNLKERLSASGITFVSINFVDTEAGAALEQAIEKEGIAKKAVETAEQERLRSEIEAQKRVVEAEADKQKAVIEAETKLIEAQAEADANKKLSESLTPQLIQKMEMEARQKWGWVTIQGANSIVVDERK